MKRLLVFAGLCSLMVSSRFAQPSLAQQTLSEASEIAYATVMLMMLDYHAELCKQFSGEPVTGKVMESIPLRSGQQLPKGAKGLGHVAQVQIGNSTSPSILVMQFDAIPIHGRNLPIKANPRALASMMSVMDAQVPLFEPGTTPRSAILIAPVAGEASFQPDNAEKSRGKLVLFSGVPATGCGTLFPTILTRAEWNGDFSFNS